MTLKEQMLCLLLWWSWYYLSEG